MRAEALLTAPVALRSWFLAAALLAVATSAPAHRGHGVWTDITWNGEAFEIVHRMHLADAIAVNRFMGGMQAIEDMRSLARVSLYVEERFQLLGGIEPIELTTIGAEIEDDFILVFQEWVTPLPERFPPVNNSVLLDIEADSQAFIHIEGPGLSEVRERER